MTAEQVFLSEGANYFGNRLIYKNKDVGYLSGSGLTLLPNGEDELARLSEITDVVAKEVVEPKPVKAKKAKVVVEEAPEVVVEQSLDDMLAE